MKGTKTYFSSELNAVVWEIHGFINIEKFIESGLESHELLKKYSAKKQLNNIQNMKALSKDIQVWIEEVWFPEAKNSGLKHFAFLVPKDVFSKASIASVNADAKEIYGINIEYFTDEEVAKQWLVKQ